MIKGFRALHSTETCNAPEIRPSLNNEKITKLNRNFNLDDTDLVGHVQRVIVCRESHVRLLGSIRPEILQRIGQINVCIDVQVRLYINHSSNPCVEAPSTHGLQDVKDSQHTSQPKTPQFSNIKEPFREMYCLPRLKTSNENNLQHHVLTTLHYLSTSTQKPITSKTDECSSPNQDCTVTGILVCISC